MKKKIMKAIFPAAGLGTRLFPASKAIPKELLPIINKPLIQYAVEEAMAAGYKTLIFITGRHKHAIEGHFRRDYELENLLSKSGKKEALDIIQQIVPSDVECVFVKQNKQLGLGHAVLCAEKIGNEPFAVLLPDDYIDPNGQNTIGDLTNAYNNNKKMQLSVMRVDGEEILKYGVVDFGIDQASVKGLIEKPEYINAPSNYASIGRYVLSPEIFTTLKNLKKGYGDEIQLADAINVHASMGQVEVQKLKSTRFDCGSVEGFLAASKYSEKSKKFVKDNDNE